MAQSPTTGVVNSPSKISESKRPAKDGEAGGTHESAERHRLIERIRFADKSRNKRNHSAAATASAIDYVQATVVRIRKRCERRMGRQSVKSAVPVPVSLASPPNVSTKAASTQSPCRA